MRRAVLIAAACLLAALAARVRAQAVSSCAQSTNVACLAGGAGSANDPPLSSTAAENLYGSAAASGGLDPKASSQTNTAPVTVLAAGGGLAVDPTTGAAHFGMQDPDGGNDFRVFQTQAHSGDVTYARPAERPAMNGRGLAASSGVTMKRNASAVDVCAHGAACDGTIGATTALVSGTDDATTVQNAINDASTNGGGTVVVPGGRKVLLSTGITLKDGVGLRCETGGGFILPARQCQSGGFVGAPCAGLANTCPGDSCECPSGACSGTQFAATAGTSYPIVSVSATKPNRVPGVQGCTFWGMQLSPYYTCTIGARAGKTCTTNDTNTTTGCPGNAQCTGGGTPFACCTGSGTGSCGAAGVCGALAGYPSGPGKINPIDLSNSSASNVVIRDNTFVDIRMFDQQISANAAWNVQVLGNRTGAIGDGVCCGVSTGGCSTTPPGSLGFDCGLDYGTLGTGSGTPPSPALDGIVGATFVQGNVIGGFSRHGITLPAGSEAASNTVLGDDVTAWAFNVVGQHVRIHDNFVSNTHTCLGASSPSDNITFHHNRCFFGAGPKIIISGGAGWQIDHNYLAWGQSNPVIAFGSTAAGALSATAFDHHVIDANLLFTQNAGGVGIQIADTGKRCNSGANQYKTCTTNDTSPSTGCGAGASCGDGGCCIAVTVENIRIQDNEFYLDPTAVDVSGLTSSGNTSLSNSVIADNLFAANATGVSFPSASAKITGLALNANAFGSVTTPIANWSWSYGNLVGSSPPLSFTRAQLVVGTPANGNTVYCSDCDDFARSGGAGAQVTSVDGRWVALTADRPPQNVREWHAQKRDDIGGRVAIDFQGIDSAVNRATGTASDLVDTTGTYINYASAASNPSDAGWKSARFTLTRTNQQPVFTSVVKLGTEAFSRTIRVFAGLTSADAMGSKSPTTVHACGLAFDTSGSADTKWMCMTCNASACTRTATSVAAAPDTRYVLKVAATATECDCSIDGTLEVAQTATLPTSTIDLGYETQVRTLAASSRALRISKIDMLHE